MTTGLCQDTSLYPRSSATIITMLGLVVEAVVKGRWLSDSQARGYLRYKFMESLRRKVPEVGYIPEFFSGNIVFDNG